jgi:hypothetical protein
MTIFVVPVHDPEQMSAKLEQRRTRSMVHERTQTIEGHGTRNTMSLDDYDTPIANFINVKNLNQIKIRCINS